MNGSRSIRAGVGLAVFLSVFATVQSKGETVDQVRGSITVDGERVDMTHILVDRARTFPLSVLVSDVALPAPCEPLDAMVFVEQQPFSGLLFRIGEDLTAWQSLNGLYHPSLPPNQGYGKGGSGLTAERSGDAILATVREVVEIDERKYEVDLEVTISLPETRLPMTPRTIRGDDSEPKRAFEEMVDAVVATDVDAMLARSSSKMRAEMESADEIDAELLFEFADWMIPTTITIIDAQIDGDAAVLKAKGETVTCLGTETADGEIEMVRENGSWKVDKVKWQG